jgi:hypothetical protein
MAYSGNQRCHWRLARQRRVSSGPWVVRLGCPSLHTVRESSMAITISNESLNQLATKHESSGDWLQFVSSATSGLGPAARVLVVASVARSPFPRTGKTRKYRQQARRIIAIQPLSLNDLGLYPVTE